MNGENERGQRWKNGRGGKKIKYKNLEKVGAYSLGSARWSGASWDRRTFCQGSALQNQSLSTGLVHTYVHTHTHAHTHTLGMSYLLSSFTWTGSECHVGSLEHVLFPFLLLKVMHMSLNNRNGAKVIHLTGFHTIAIPPHPPYTCAVFLSWVHEIYSSLVYLPLPVSFTVWYNFSPPLRSATHLLREAARTKKKHTALHCIQSLLVFLAEKFRGAAVLWYLPSVGIVGWLMLVNLLPTPTPPPSPPNQKDKTHSCYL